MTSKTAPPRNSSSTSRSPPVMASSMAQPSKSFSTIGSKSRVVPVNSVTRSRFNQRVPQALRILDDPVLEAIPQVSNQEVLKKHQIRNYIRVIASSKNTYELRYFLVDEQDPEEEDEATVNFIYLFQVCNRQAHSVVPINNTLAGEAFLAALETGMKLLGTQKPSPATSSAPYTCEDPQFFDPSSSLLPGPKGTTAPALADTPNLPFYNL
ncbi:hypothetical protein H4Q26_006506 [Puccinia striiformis f. sp. tritici PST-130]|nr:hypothetical protein H4Q26_006506 [Puccinia striiformis f. sp. tritici PST-130]